MLKTGPKPHSWQRLDGVQLFLLPRKHVGQKHGSHKNERNPGYGVRRGDGESDDPEDFREQGSPPASCPQEGPSVPEIPWQSRYHLCPHTRSIFWVPGPGLRTSLELFHSVLTPALHCRNCYCACPILQMRKLRLQGGDLAGPLGTVSEW